MKKYLIIGLAVLTFAAGAFLVHLSAKTQQMAEETSETSVYTEATTAETMEPITELESEATGPTDNRGGSGEEHVFSHRGASGEETEHTLKAYDLAIAEGSRYIEQDVLLSKDGTLYVSHDDSAKKLTGVDRNYADMTDSEIDALQTSDGQKILKLSEVFDTYGEQVYYVIELKTDEAAEPFMEMVRKYAYDNRIIAQSENPDVLEKLKMEFPYMGTLYLTKSQEDFNSGLDLWAVDILSVKKDLMTQDNCNAAHNAQPAKKFNVWTLNEEEEIRKAIEMGVDSYFTDYTKRALDLEKQYRPDAQAGSGSASSESASSSSASE